MDPIPYDEIYCDEGDIVLTPGNGGRDCLGNGEHCGQDGNPIMMRCDECDYLICCFDNELCGKCFEKHGFCEINNRAP